MFDIRVKRSTLTVISVLFLALNGCGLFDSEVIWRGGPYILGWIDEPEKVTLSYDLGKGSLSSRIDESVFAVGWDGKYLVAKQHPNGNKNVTNFYFIDAKKDNPYASPEQVVSGPFAEPEFEAKAMELHLPRFSKELPSLK